MDERKADDATVCMRACRSSYIVFSVIFGVILALCVAAIIVRPDGAGEFLIPIGLVLALYLFVVAWLRGFEVTIQSGVIPIKKFLRRRVVFPASQITYFDFEVGDDEQSSNATSQ